jgi:hypothetical protein
MRKVVVYELLSLDGVAEKPDPFFADWDDAMEANLGAVIAAQDSVILGRRSYDEWAEFWPGSDIEPFPTFIKRPERPSTVTVHFAHVGARHQRRCEVRRRAREATMRIEVPIDVLLRVAGRRDARGPRVAGPLRWRTVVLDDRTSCGGCPTPIHRPARFGAGNCVPHYGVDGRTHIAIVASEAL